MKLLYVTSFLLYQTPSPISRPSLNQLAPSKDQSVGKYAESPGFLRDKPFNHKDNVGDHSVSGQDCEG